MPPRSKLESKRVTHRKAESPVFYREDQTEKEKKKRNGRREETVADLYWTEDTNAIKRE